VLKNRGQGWRGHHRHDVLHRPCHGSLQGGRRKEELGSGDCGRHPRLRSGGSKLARWLGSAVAFLGSPAGKLGVARAAVELLEEGAPPLGKGVSVHPVAALRLVKDSAPGSVEIRGEDLRLSDIGGREDVIHRCSMPVAVLSAAQQAAEVSEDVE
jgi:hypothetical protein